MNIIIGLSGTFASGKDTGAEYLTQRYGFAHYSTGDMVREVAMSKHGSIERPILHKTAEEMRKEHGPGVFVHLIMDKIKAGHHKHRIVVSGIRSTGESRAIQEAGGQVIFIDAPAELRHSRMVKRARDQEKNLTLKEFIDFEQKEWHQGDDPADFNLKGIKQEANHQIDNSTDIANLHQQLDAILAPYL